MHEDVAQNGEWADRISGWRAASNAVLSFVVDERLVGEKAGQEETDHIDTW